ncbi:hypothetical protein E4U42_005989 [Claviceps africana]|uniref:Uncharacterized protein n=1 Tax=Claviceps africana TaxID=83212 RepID=A0A8K0J304_9HYPO|nr:hypothetical protein E4U42_005989 [Claviceps africana]
MNLTCNSTLEDMRILPGSEKILVGPLDFHNLARLIGSSCTLIATVLSLYLVWMHALNYTQPREQRYIIRILFMVPVYAISSYFQIQWYWHAIYFQVISDCYEAFAIASFFALLCHYVAPDLHSQKVFFRELHPIKQWVMPINWFGKCCGGQRGIWRIPKSGLTWFNIVWVGVYQYCFVRVAMTISAVVLQYNHRYCEPSNLPVFGHIWIIVLNALAVTIAMYCLVQFYVQLKGALVKHNLFIKILAIKLVVFLSFWQASSISVGTSTLNIVRANDVLAYPDLKVGIPALLLCVEMAMFAVLHLWAFPYAPYVRGAPRTFYPVPDSDKISPSVENQRHPPAGGFLGLAAIGDALNVWDFIKAFGRGMRWLFCGVKRRKEDISYRLDRVVEHVDMDHRPDRKEDPRDSRPYQNRWPGTGHFPSTIQEYGQSGPQSPFNPATGRLGMGEQAGLMDNTQQNPEVHSHAHARSRPPPRPVRDPPLYESPFQPNHHHIDPQEIGVAYGHYEPRVAPNRMSSPSNPFETQETIGQALWRSEPRQL